MSLLSKLLGGDKKAEKAARDLLTGLLGNAANKPAASQNNTAAQRPEAAEQSAFNSPSGDSWGAYMPAEENQFSFKGSFTDYFETIFREDFPAYRFEKTFENNGRRIIYTFYSAAGKILVVELMPESCSA